MKGLDKIVKYVETKEAAKFKTALASELYRRARGKIAEKKKEVASKIFSGK